VTAPVENGSRRRAYCTYFDSNYIARGIVMLDTLLAHDTAAAIHVLCFDDTTEKVLNAEFGARITTISLDRLHRFDPRIPELRTTRSTWAFYATHKAALASYVMTECGPFEWVTVIDADTAFYGNLAPVFDEIEDASIGVSPHRFAEPDDPQARFGKFNAGFICFRDNPIARRCLSDWREDCIQWCEETVLPDGRFMNQGYLNRWPDRYPNVAIIEHPGANLAPWNVRSHHLTEVSGIRYVDDEPLIFFHFSGLSRDAAGHWHARKEPGFESLNSVLAKLYKPYIETLERIGKKLLATYGVSGSGSVRFQGHS
jgi:hypothetical protein